jgi:Cu2+-exporting ATPase
MREPHDHAIKHEEKGPGDFHSHHGHHAGKDEMASVIMDPHAGHKTENFLRRFWICLLLTIPVLLLSRMIQLWFGFDLRFNADKFVLFVLGSLIYFYGGYPFLIGLVRELKSRNTGMMTLIAVAISVAYLYSTAVAFGLLGMDFYWSWLH